MTTTWRHEIELERKCKDDGPIVACTLTDEQLDIEFDDGFGLAKGLPFTAWSDSRVYFPTEYDGAERCRSVPRDPSDEVTEHIS